jgi:hypothetical protein
MRGHSTRESSAYEDARMIAEEACVFGYPLLVMDAARRVHTAVPSASPQGAPANQFAHTRILADARDRNVARPNVDSLGSVAWLDVSKEPVILNIPSIDRYFCLPIWSAWYDLLYVASTRTVGSGNRVFAIVGPWWEGNLPERVERVHSPTETVWINARFQASGVEDSEAVHRLQDQLRLTPLSEWGTAVEHHPQPFPTNVDQRSTPVEQVDLMDASTFYSRLAKLLQKSRPRTCDLPVIEQLKQIGLEATEDFSLEDLPETTSHAMRTAATSARMKIAAAEEKAIPALANNWSLHVHPGRFETNYLNRAVAVRLGLASSPVEDVVSLRTNTDSNGDFLKGTHQYVIRFDQSHIPPVNAFWSITLYNSKHLLAANSIQRHVIGDLNKLRLSPDRSLSIYIQHEWPGVEKDSNWLPAPGEAFELVFQLYWPRLEVLHGRWRPPGVTRVH